MGLRRSSGSDGADRHIPSSVAIEYESPAPAADPTSIEVAASAGGRSGRLLLAALALVAAAVVAVVAAGDRSERVAENIRNIEEAEAEALTPQPFDDAQLVPEPNDATTEAAEPEGFPLELLPTAPDEWVEGTAMAWFDGAELRIRQLSTGEDVEIADPPRIQIPPLPEGLELLGARNRTYAISGGALASSGVISQTWRMVRLGDGVASFGFLEEKTDGVLSLATGTLWGPSVRPLVDIEPDATVSVVPGRGFIASYPNGTSELVTSAELREAPSRLGRIVAASSDRLAGVYCDGVGVCVGRLTGWDGADERELDPTILAGRIVELFERDDHIFSWTDGTATVVDPEGTTWSWEGGPPFNESLVWDPATGRMFWVEQDQLLVIDPFAARPQAHVVRSAGDIELGDDAELLLV